MSNPMSPPGGGGMNIPGSPAGGMQQNGAPGGADPLAAARSLTNPTDMAGMTRDVGDPSQVTVAEGFQRALGIDVNTATMAEFNQLIQQRMDPDPNKKAARMAAGPPIDPMSPPPGRPPGRPPGGPPGAAPVRPPGVGRAPGGGQDLEALIGQMS